MTTQPMMKCGHAANAVDTATGAPVCVICIMVDGDDATIVDDTPPDLTARTARCSYFGSVPSGRSASGPCNSGSAPKAGVMCRCEVPSSPSLAFFEHRPDHDHDRYYCGCWGWD